MQIGLHDADNTNFPNLALMKLSAWHKRRWDKVSRFNASNRYDKIYSSKVFTFNNIEAPLNAICGGTGYNISNRLPEEIEHIKPDYSLYNLDYSLGFLTRGCINKCPWCIVPEKEGELRPNADIEEFLNHRKVVLMDNNPLASKHGIKQIEKMIKLDLRVDFNQGLDARLIDEHIAKRLASLKWLYPIRLACDTESQIKYIQKAVSLLRWHNAVPRRYFVYVLIKDVNEALERIKFLKGLDLDPFGQPYRDFKNNIEPTFEQKQLARWINTKICFKSMTWEEYKTHRSGRI